MEPTALPTDVFESGGMPVPLDTLASKLESIQDFSAGAAVCARVFHSVERDYPPVEIFRLLAGDIPPRWLELVLFCLVDTGYTDLQMALQVLRLKCLRRLYMRWATGAPLSTSEQSLASEVRARLHIDDVPNLLACAHFFRQVAERLFQRQYVHDAHRRELAFLAASEAEALRIRVRRLSASVDLDREQTCARVLPMIRLFEQNVGYTRRLAETIEHGTVHDVGVTTFERNYGTRAMDQLLEALRKQPELEPFYRLLSLQRKTLIPTRALVAMTTLCRWIDEGQGTRTNILGWMCASLLIWQEGKFEVDAGEAIEAIAGPVRNAGAFVEGSRISGNFTSRLYSQWIGHDLLTRPFEHARRAIDGEDEQEETIKQLVRAHVGNDAIINRALDNAKAYSTPGLVEFIATRSRSVAVLSRIASRAELYSGQANGGVPRALMQNPASIPMALLRKFLRPSFFTPRELKSLVSGSSSIRSQIAREILAYLEK